MSARGLSLMSGGLDSQLAVRVLERAGAEVEAVTFTSPFFKSREAERAAAALGVKLHILDFTDDIVALIERPPHGFGGAMNPCIDCHARMIARAGELMRSLGFDFVATGEVQGQRPMSQNRQSMQIVAKAAGLGGRLVRPLSARLLEPTLPELSGQLDRERLLDLSGRARDRQIALAAEFGIVEYPSPAGGCWLTEAGFAKRLADLMTHEGLRRADGSVNRELLELLATGRRFRLPGGSSVILGRDAGENARLRAATGTVIADPSRPGPTALVPVVKAEADLELARGIVGAWSRGATGRERFRSYQIL